MKKRLLELNHKYSVGSGVFAGIDKDFYMKLDEYGQYKYFLNKKLDNNLLKKINKVDIMSDYSENEDSLGYKCFGKINNIKHNRLLGFYSNLYAGCVKEGNFRKIASSGGFGTWLLCELLRKGLVDGVIHPQPVDPKDNDGILFKYKVSTSEEEIKKGAKSYYYPMELSEVLKIVENKPGKYAIIGISELITELRLLCEQKDIFKKRLVFMIGLFNAHQKTTKYVEALAWQEGIEPGNLEKVDFRIKSKSGGSGDYMHRFEGSIKGKRVVVMKNIKNSPIQRWNMGFFKARFSDFTDNAFNELADVTLGDAWLQDYIQDPKGNNILIIRNQKIKKIIEDAIIDNRIYLDKKNEEEIISSQQIITHIIDSLPYRLHKNKKFNHFVPRKRTQPEKDIPFIRRRIQDLRQYIVNKNGYIYNKALKKNDFNIYIKFVNRCERINNVLYKTINCRLSIIDSLRAIKNKFKTRKLINLIKKTILKIKHFIRVKTRFLIFLGKVKNRKKSGAIISLTGYFNYGNILQRYALKSFLEKNGYNFDAIKTQEYKERQSRAIFGNMIDFVDKYIKEKTIKSNLEMVGYKNYIVGSDQVWRDWYGGKWEDFSLFFLDFLGNRKAKRIAYAASFGVDNLADAGIDEQKKELIKPLIDKFDYISVREKSAINLVNELATNDEINIETVLDPVFLLKKEDYSSVINDSELKYTKTQRLFCYILDLNDGKKEIIKMISKRFNNKYSIINPDENKRYKPVEEWLKGFRDSEYVITDSFHGVALSIINNKDFIVFANKFRGQSRIKSLLDYFGVNNDRIVDSESKSLNVDFYSKIKKIDWDFVNTKINDGRAFSIKWLSSILNNSYFKDK